MAKSEAKAIADYRRRRIQRLRARYDADDDDNGNNAGGPSRGHGNTKLPFGLCQREGIKVDPKWTPSDAWNALEGKGYSAKDTYKELKETGKVSPKAPKKTPAEIKKMGKTVSDLKKAMKKRDKLEKDSAAANSKLSEAIRSKERYESASAKYKKLADDLVEKYGSEENIPSKREGEYGYPPYASYQLYRDNERSYAKDAEDIEKTIPELTKKKEDLDQQLSDYPSKDEHKKQYDQAVDELLSNSPYTKRVRDFRAIEEESEETRNILAEAQRKVEQTKSHIEFYERMARVARSKGDEETAKFYEGNGLATNKKLLAANESYVALFSKQVAEYDRRMNEAKGDAADKDWKQIYELSVDRDTVQDGPYTEFKRMADSLTKGKVKYLNPVKYVNTPADEKIIKDLCGADKTSGSCASLAFAYFANKSGYKVLDFRGGASRRFFSWNCGDVLRKLGGSVTHDSDGFKIANDHLSKVEEGKEYYFAAGKHAAVVRKKNGKLEFLELQDRDGGWSELNDSVLKSRFKVKRTSRRDSEYSYLIEGGKISESQEMISLMGYINTASDKQKKGAGGGIK